MRLGSTDTTVSNEYHGMATLVATAWNSIANDNWCYTETSVVTTRGMKRVEICAV